MKIEALQGVISQYHVWNCLDCGKCSALCPITRWEAAGYSSPRLLVEMAFGGRVANILEDRLLWACLTCKRCSDLCPAGVNFPELVRGIRALAREDGYVGECTHGGIFQTLSQMMTDSELRQNRLDWLSDDLRISEESDTVFFVGCSPYYAAVFDKLGVDVLAATRSSIKILNHLGIEPQVIADERCCGHDQLWQGDLETFRFLAELNIGKFDNIGAKRIITSCPECARTLKLDYPKISRGNDFEVVHILELIAKSNLFAQFSTGDMTAGNQDMPNVTYQDPCRLGRHMGVYDAPRNIVSGLGFSLTEMERSRRTSQCCGTSCWTACGQINKNIQVERLKEAKSTGAEMLITSCVKCQIHFKCAQNDLYLSNEITIEIRDLLTLLAERL